MLLLEKELRDALDLMDGVPVAGRDHRANMAKAEVKIMAVANALAAATKMEAKANDHAENEQRNDAQCQLSAESGKKP